MITLDPMYLPYINRMATSIEPTVTCLVKLWYEFFLSSNETAVYLYSKILFVICTNKLYDVCQFISKNRIDRLIFILNFAT